MFISKGEGKIVVEEVKNIVEGAMKTSVVGEVRNMMREMEGEQEVIGGDVYSLRIK